MTVTEAMLESWGITDIDEFIELFGEPIDVGDDGAIWSIDGTDADNDGIPDVLADLVSDPITTNDSQGGILG